MENLEQILQEKNSQDAIIKIDQYIAELCQYGTQMDKLTDPQKNFYYIESLAREVHNGGFAQFFENSDGEFAHEALEALRIIGAQYTAELVQKALALWPKGKVPKDRIEREELLEKMGEKIFDEWDKLDQKFYTLKEDLYALLLEYVRKNKEAF